MPDVCPACGRRQRQRGRPQTLDDAVVKEIVAAADDGVTAYRIAKNFNVLGVATARGGRQWYPSTVTRVLESRAAQRIRDGA